MPRTLPPEIFDLIIDHLHDEPAALKACCIVSKSWVPRTRKHLFARIEFNNRESLVELWKRAFPDPSNSPAHYTRSLLFFEIPLGSNVDADGGDWIRSFHNVERLGFCNASQASLVPFHGLSPTVRSLSLILSTTDVFDFICSFPLLEDLTLVTLHPESYADGWNAPSTSPKLTGTLYLRLHERTHSVIRRLLDLPGGVHFSKFNVKFFDGETESMKDLVSRCSDTLEFLIIHHRPSAIPSTVFVDLSKATKLKHVKFLRTNMRSTVQWITKTLQTVDSKNFQSITICPENNVPETVGEATHQEWNDLDRLLVQFWTSHSIRPQVTYVTDRGGKDFRVDAPSLLPGLTRRGLVDIVETPS